MSDPATAEPARTGGSASVRTAVVGASFGFFVDMFDVYLPVVALTPAMNYFLPSSVSAGSRALITSLIFVATLIGRPLGSLIFGRLADKVGRRRVTLWSVLGCGVCTLLIALLPGYHAVGLLGVVLMVVLRLVDGVFLGGEYTGATPLAMEAAPTGRRGWYGGLVGMGFPISYCAISLVTFVMLRIAHSGGPTSPYSQWGWRIPFVVGALLCAVFCVYYARTVKESETWQHAAKSRTPIRDVLVGRSRRQFVQVFVMMSGIWFASNLASGLLPSALQYEAHVSASSVTAALVIVQAIHSALFPFLGLWSERIGRRTFLAWSGVGIGVVCAAAFATISLGWWSGFGAVLLLTLIIRISGGSTFAVTPSYLCERFPPAVRGSGFGLGYSMPLVLTSFYAYYQGWLSHIMPSGMTAAALLVLGGALVLAGALMGPETRDVDLAGAAPAEATAVAAESKPAII
jgi:MFS family permease